MAAQRTLILGLICSLALIALTSCSASNAQQTGDVRHGGWLGKGPITRSEQVASEAPGEVQAQPQRRKQVCGYDLLYDRNWGVYVVIGIKDCYYHEGYFYRLRGDDWEMSERADSGWTPVSVTLLPQGLQGKASRRARLQSRTIA